MSVDSLNYTSLPIDENFVVTIKQAIEPLSPEDHKLVQTIWEAECQKQPSLFPGTILSLVEYSSSELQGRWIAYPTALAAARNTEFAKRAKITPISVTGIVRTHNHVLLGLRSQHVAQDAGCLELAPSGGIDPNHVDEDGHIDYRKAILNELWEETGIATSQVQGVHPVAMLIPHPSGSIEICLNITLKGDQLPELKPNTTEYAQLFWIPEGQACQLIRNSEYPVVPLTQQLIQAWSL